MTGSGGPVGDITRLGWSTLRGEIRTAGIGVSPSDAISRREKFCSGFRDLTWTVVGL